jgi:hypothetical protein
MTTELNQKKSKPKISSRGGARPGAGRPPGVRNKVTVQDLLEAIETQTGTGYEALLVEDFLTARAGNDNHLIHKYHSLISGKILSTLTQIEVTEPEDQISAKTAAFQEAWSRLVTLSDRTK